MMSFHYLLMLSLLRSQKTIDELIKWKKNSVREARVKYIHSEVFRIHFLPQQIVSRTLKPAGKRFEKQCISKNVSSIVCPQQHIQIYNFGFIN